MMTATRKILRVVFLGRPCCFSAVVFEWMLGVSVEVVGLLVPGEVIDVGPVAVGDPRLPVAPHYNNGLYGLAAAAKVPIRGFDVDHGLAALSWLQELAPDVLLAGCFPRIVSPSMLAVPTLGAFNIHPSLLPAYRGPTPLFWQFRAGERRGGVTLHEMEPRVDAGPIVAQCSTHIEFEDTAALLNERLAKIGAVLAGEALDTLSHLRSLRSVVQTEAGVSHQSWPTESDFVVDSNWSGERMYRFVRGTREWQRPYRIRVGESMFAVSDVFGFELDGSIGQAYELDGEQLRIQFRDGVLSGKGSGEVVLQ